MIEITQHIAVVGAGLSGTLLTICLAQRGFNVDLFEKRPDLRKVELDSGRSINLALSDRGLKAMALVGLEEAVRELCIPMHGRMIHDMEGNLRMSPYSGRSSDYINSVSRPGLNALLLDKAETYPNVNLFFDAEIEDVDIANKRIRYNYLEQDIAEEYDIILGTDGAGSMVRGSMSKYLGDAFDLSVDFLDYGYKELEIPQAEGGGYQIADDALHIWPRGNFMIIALPNLDGSFTVTMFNPYKGAVGFEELKEDPQILAYFKQYFPDLVDKLPALQDDFDDHPVGRLGTVKCSPWHVDGSVCIMGDAAHAIVPFYGQGMNASFEDVYVFDHLLAEHMNKTWEEMFESFETARKENADAIADLALDNFIEMRDKVDDPAFIVKRKLEMALEQNFPAYFSKYSLVTFTDLSYAQALKQGRRQDAYLLEKCQNPDFKVPTNKEELQEILTEMQNHLNYNYV